jgi:hypothetical protein
MDTMFDRTTLFPDTFEDDHGKIHRPPTWSRRSEGPRDAGAL